MHPMNKGTHFDYNNPIAVYKHPCKNRYPTKKGTHSVQTEVILLIRLFRT